MRFHEDFQAPYRHSENPRLRVEAIDKVLVKAKAHERVLQRLDETLRQALAAAEAVVERERTDSPHARSYRDDLREALAQVAGGPSPHEGVLPLLSAIVGLPGLTATQAEIARLEAERAEWAPRVDEDPEAVALYRLLPGQKYHHDGRRMHAGEVVPLTRRAYNAFADKFEPAESATAG